MKLIHDLNQKRIMICSFFLLLVLLGTPALSAAQWGLDVPKLDLSVLPEINQNISFEIKVTFPQNALGTDLKFELLSSTKHFGQCISHDGDNQERKPDLELRGDDNNDWEQDTDRLPLTRTIRATQSASYTETYSAIVYCRDSAAAGKVRITLTPSTGARLQHIRRIPLDDNTNGIADGWEKQYIFATKPTGGEDEDTSPANGNDGDGLSVFEEYRGAKLVGGLPVTRFDPTTKDIFVRHAHNNNTLQGKCCGNNGGRPLSCHEIGSTSGDVVNSNTSLARPVFAIVISENTDAAPVNLPPGGDMTVGEASGKANVSK